jgi:hypothetical protein
MITCVNVYVKHGLPYVYNHKCLAIPQKIDKVSFMLYYLKKNSQ